VLELHDRPLAFARMRRGDSYGGWRMVFSELEEKQRSLVFEPCDEFRRNLQIAKSSLYKNAWLHQHTLKSHARNKRELRKHIMRKWGRCGVFAAARELTSPPRQTPCASTAPPRSCRRRASPTRSAIGTKSTWRRRSCRTKVRGLPRLSLRRRLCGKHNLTAFRTDGYVQNTIRDLQNQEKQAKPGGEGGGL
jgi:hypothetical protein